MPWFSFSTLKASNYQAFFDCGAGTTDGVYLSKNIKFSTPSNYRIFSNYQAFILIFNRYDWFPKKLKSLKTHFIESIIAPLALLPALCPIERFGAPFPTVRLFFRSWGLYLPLSEFRLGSIAISRVSAFSPSGKFSVSCGFAPPARLGLISTLWKIFPRV